MITFVYKFPLSEIRQPLFITEYNIEKFLRLRESRLSLFFCFEEKKLWKMRILVAIIIGTVFSITSCKQDPITVYDVCKPEDRPEIIDTGNHTASNRLKGEWQLTNTINLNDPDFLQIGDLKGRKPVLKFQNDREIKIKAPINDCWGKYYTATENNRRWLYLEEDRMKCTLVVGTEWEINYLSAVRNSTCYRMNQNTLTVQYYIDEEKKGNLVYKKVN